MADNRGPADVEGGADPAGEAGAARARPRGGSRGEEQEPPSPTWTVGSARGSAGEFRKKVGSIGKKVGSRGFVLVRAAVAGFGTGNRDSIAIAPQRTESGRMGPIPAGARRSASGQFHVPDALALVPHRVLRPDALFTAKNGKGMKMVEPVQTPQSPLFSSNAPHFTATPSMLMLP